MRTILIVASLVVFAFGPAGAAQITIAVVPSVPGGTTYVALDKGYFRDAGLDVTIERIDSLGKAVAFLATNQVQVAQGGINAGFYNAVAQGLPVSLALESGSSPTYHQILVRTDLKDKIRTPADLKGRTVGLSSPGSTSMYEVASVLASAKLTLKDVDVKNLAFSQMAAAMANDALDAAMEVAPFTERMIEQKIGVPWIDPDDYISAAADEQRRLYRQYRLGAKQPRSGGETVRRAGARRAGLLSSLSSWTEPRRDHRYLSQIPHRHRPRVARPHGLAVAQPRRRV